MSDSYGTMLYNLRKGFMICHNCKVFYWKHDDGWDVYYQSDGYKYQDTWIPDWFDSALLEDCQSKQDAKKEATEYYSNTHLLGVCTK